MGSDTEASPRRKDELRRNGIINGQFVRYIILDTGCTRTLVHQKLIPQGKKSMGEVIIRCTHGDEISYLVTEVEIEVGGRKLTVNAGISHALPASVLLGTDVLQLLTMFQATQEESGGGERAKEEALAVMIPAQARRQEELSATEKQKEKIIWSST